MNPPSPVVLYVGLGVALWLLAVGLWGVVTSRHLVHLVLCLTVIQASTYVVLTVVGHRPGAVAPVFVASAKDGAPAVDPVVQALMLTDVVVEATVVALLLAITIKIHRCTGSADPDVINVLRG